MNNARFWIPAAILLVFPVSSASADGSDWSLDLGLRWFKHAAEGGPNEIGPGAVFDRWEAINQDREGYRVSSYQALEPLYFNFNFGADVMVRFRYQLF
jgi:hypothetical protein